jgi:hypothetical protein
MPPHYLQASAYSTPCSIFAPHKRRPSNACVTCEARPAKQVGAILAGLSGIFSFFFELSYVPMDLCIVHTE